MLGVAQPRRLVHRWERFDVVDSSRAATRRGPRRDPRSGRRASSGRWNQNTRRAVGSGSKPAREPGLVAGRLVAERQTAVGRAHRWQLVGDVGLVLDRLPLDPGERGALLLGLDHPDGLAVHEQHVVGRPGSGHQLPDGDALTRVQVDALVVLNDPPRPGQHVVDPNARPILRGDVVARIVRRHQRNCTRSPGRRPEGQRPQPDVTVGSGPRSRPNAASDTRRLSGLA